jgi:hypothetical protein
MPLALRRTRFRFEAVRFFDRFHGEGRSRARSPFIAFTPTRSSSPSVHAAFSHSRFAGDYRSESEAKLAPARAMRLLPAGEPVRKRREIRKHLRRQDRDRLQSRRHVNIVDFTGVSYARDVYELWRPEDALLTKSVAAGGYSFNRQKVYGINDVRFLAENSLTKRALNSRILLRYLQVYGVYAVYENWAPAEVK